MVSKDTWTACTLFHSMIPEVCAWLSHLSLLYLRTCLQMLWGRVSYNTSGPQELNLFTVHLTHSDSPSANSFYAIHSAVPCSKAVITVPEWNLLQWVKFFCLYQSCPKSGSGPSHRISYFGGSVSNREIFSAKHALFHLTQLETV